MTNFYRRMELNTLSHNSGIYTPRLLAVYTQPYKLVVRRIWIAILLFGLNTD